MNKQPWYCRAVLLFTATEEIDEEEVKSLLRDALVSYFKKNLRDVVLEDSIQCEEIAQEPGDPHDLME